MLRDLVKKFEDVVELPIEIQEICDALVQMGHHEHVTTSPQEMDTDLLQGSFSQFWYSPGVYRERVLVTLIVYPVQADLARKRAICAKEIVHVCDDAVRKVRTPEQLSDLANMVVGPIRDADMVAILDVLTQKLATALLFPKAARELARQRMEEGMTLEEVAAWVCAPIDLVAEMLDPSFEEVIERLIDSY